MDFLIAYCQSKNEKNTFPNNGHVKLGPSISTL